MGEQADLLDFAPGTVWKKRPRGEVTNSDEKVPIRGVEHFGNVLI